jgi:hypothetical protein
MISPQDHCGFCRKAPTRGAGRVRQMGVAKLGEGHAIRSRPSLTVGQWSGGNLIP